MYALAAFVLAVCPLVAAQSAAVFESTAVMTLSWESTTPLDLASIYTLERDTSAYLMTQLRLSAANEDDVLSLEVAVRSQAVRNSRVVLENIVSAIYQAEIPVDLDTILRRNTIDQDDLVGLSKRLNRSPLLGSYVPFEDVKVLTKVNLENSQTAADKGLIVAVSFLALLLMIVSSTLLYVTGGWSACKIKCVNCLFEEVDADEVDDYQVQKKATFQVQSYDEEDAQSKMSGNSAPTNPSGILGVRDEKINPAYGMGIKTPERGYNPEIETPMSDMTGAPPLGITSMRKMPQADDKTDGNDGGLAHMIMGRLYGESKN